jgi:hypothetical protein
LSSPAQPVLVNLDLQPCGHKYDFVNQQGAGAGAKMTEIRPCPALTLTFTKIKKELLIIKIREFEILKRKFVDGRIRTYAGKPHMISSHAQ